MKRVTAAILMSLSAACGGAGSDPGGGGGSVESSAGSGGKGPATTGKGSGGHGTSPSAGGGAAGGGGSDSGAGTGTGAAPGELLFVGNFETGDLSQWAYVERCENDRITVYSTSDDLPGAPAPRDGLYAARFRVLDDDVEPCTSTENPRAELETSESLFQSGDEVWEAFSIYVPSAHPEPSCGSCQGGSWLLIQEDYGAPWDGSPSIGWTLDLTNGNDRITMDRGEQYGHDRPFDGKLTTGKWVDLLVHKRFSNTNDGTGFVEAWVDGEPLSFDACGCTKLITQTMHTTQDSLGFYLTSYRAHGFLDAFDVYYDAVRIGTTREIVELE